MCCAAHKPRGAQRVMVGDGGSPRLLQEDLGWMPPANNENKAVEQRAAIKSTAEAWAPAA
jgi:hypothetical protein